MEQFLITLFMLYFVSSNARAEQNYSGNSVLNCSIKHENRPSSAFLYTCNGLSKSCLAFLIFKSQPPYNTVTSISNLTSSEPEELAAINRVSMFTVFPTGKEVIVPVNCNCKTKDYYQADTNYTLPTIQTYFTIANDTYQGLSTCNSLLRYNPYGALDLHAGMQLHVPLRCACPTQSQIASGTKYLLTYAVDWGDNVSSLATRYKRSVTFVEARYTIRKTKLASSEEIRDEIAGIEHVSKEYRFEEIKEATEDFSSKNRLGGSVYWGVFGKDILAVKRMRTDASKEVKMLKKINHFNVIKLQGYCKNEGFFYLVFEYMENGSLREWLEKNVPTEHQSWGKRIQISLDIANGLQYLHNFTEPCYVHKDINTSNILLNKNVRAKIANFRLAKESEGDIICNHRWWEQRLYGS
ncbi:protein LYK5-like [Prosopis cineraria]|uniref:protein LYK5-like n=1 Tax=Prosopis cineraria TaxID=364024 RepID=UPI00240EC6CB|nr:protein LYK5-like [Prosopis cineraria]